MNCRQVGITSANAATNTATATIPILYQAPKPRPAVRRTPFTPRLPEGKPLRSFYSIDNDDDGSMKLDKSTESGRRASLSSIPKEQQSQDKRIQNECTPKPLRHQYSLLKGSYKSEASYFDTKSMSNGSVKHRATFAATSRVPFKQTTLTKSQNVTISDSGAITHGSSRSTAKLLKAQGTSNSSVGLSADTTATLRKSHGHSKKKSKSKHH
jgi:hypothetical protein